MKVAIFDQHRRLYDAKASQVSLPGEDGAFVVLDYHAPMISLLKNGEILLDGKYLPIKRGIAMVNQNELFVLVER